MRGFGLIFLICAAVLMTAAIAFAVPAGKTLEFTGSPMGKVIFDGSVHAKKVASCNDCHKTGLFEKMKKGSAPIKMADMYEGKFCGVCHNGDVTFNLKDNCSRCHKL